MDRVQSGCFSSCPLTLCPRVGPPGVCLLLGGPVGHPVGPGGVLCPSVDTESLYAVTGMYIWSTVSGCAKRTVLRPEGAVAGDGGPL